MKDFNNLTQTHFKDRWQRRRKAKSSRLPNRSPNSRRCSTARSATTLSASRSSCKCNSNTDLLLRRDRDRRIGNLKCRICSTGHRSRIHHLSAAVDVYCNWIDDCHRVNQVGPQKSFQKKLGDKAKPIEATEQDGFSDEEGHI